LTKEVKKFIDIISSILGDLAKVKTKSLINFLNGNLNFIAYYYCFSWDLSKHYKKVFFKYFSS